MLQSLSQNRLFQFIYGTTGIYLFAFTSSVIHQKLFKRPYASLSHENADYFKYPVSLLLFPYLAGWVLGYIVSRISSGTPVAIPTKNVVMCGVAVIGGTLSYNIAILYMSYPIVIMMKSCSILSAIIVGVFFSRVRDEKLKLGTNKLIVGALVTVGILLFNYFAAASEKTQGNASYFGLFMILVSLVADGLLPDFQAQVKSVFKPRSIDLLWQSNRAVLFLSLAYSIISTDLFGIVDFLLDHPSCFLDLCSMAFLNFFIQMFVYYMINHFKQHVVPFVITIRKILSVVVSLVWFNHETNALQITGILVVFLAAVYDFYSEKAKGASVPSHTENKSSQNISMISLDNKDMIPLQQSNLSDDEDQK